MAKQIEVTTSGNTFSFPTPQIRVVQFGIVSFIDFNGRNYPTTSTVAALVALANTGGTEQVQATIVRVNEGIQTSSLQMSFPASNITIDESSLSGANSVIVFKGNNYYAEETKDALVTAANAGGGGGTQGIDDVLAQEQDFTADREIDCGGHFLYIYQPQYPSGNIVLMATGDVYLGDADGDVNNTSIKIRDVQKLIQIRTAADGNVIYSSGIHTFEGAVVSSWPTSDPHVADQLWNNAGTLKVSAG